MKYVIIVGCGSHASELVDYIEYINKHAPTKQFEIKGLIDDKIIHYHHYKYNYEFIGTITDHVIDPTVYYIMGIGSLSSRNFIFEKFKSAGATFTGIIHPTALVSDSAEIGEGTIISHNVSVGPKAKIGPFNVINSRSTIGHDTVIGYNNFISPQVVLGGYAKLGNTNFLGTNCCVLPSIEIANNNQIMAGMTVNKQVNSNETVFFRYKEKLVVRQ